MTVFLFFGLYQNFANNVTVEYKENGKTMKDDYVVQTSAIVNHYMDNRSISDLQQTKLLKSREDLKIAFIW